MHEDAQIHTRRLTKPPQHILAPSQITFDAVTILRFIHAEFHFRDQWTMSLSLVFYLSAHLSIYMYSAASHVKSFAVQDTSANSFSSMPLLLPGRTLHHEWLLWDIDRRCWSGSLRSANLLILCETRTWCVLHYNWGELLLFGPFNSTLLNFDLYGRLWQNDSSWWVYY